MPSLEGEGLGWVKWLLLALLGVLWATSKASASPISPQLPKDATSPGGAWDNTGDGSMIYWAGSLTPSQVSAADIIVSLAQTAGLDPAFMLALAVTESSLRPAIVGDDGVSVGLFQINTRFNPSYSVSELQDAGTNAGLAMNMMAALISGYPGHTYGDYAEAWTLGGHGRFDLGRRNPGKAVHMQQTVVDLGLALDLNAGPA